MKKHTHQLFRSIFRHCKEIVKIIVYWIIWFLEISRSTQDLYKIFTRISADWTEVKILVRKLCISVSAGKIGSKSVTCHEIRKIKTSNFSDFDLDMGEWVILSWFLSLTFSPPYEFVYYQGCLISVCHKI